MESEEEFASMFEEARAELAGEEPEPAKAEEKPEPTKAEEEGRVTRRKAEADVALEDGEDAGSADDAETPAPEKSDEEEAKFNELAKKLGYEVRDKLAAKDFVELRHEKQRMQKNLDRKVAEAQERMNSIASGLEQRYKPYMDLEAAHKSGDRDAVFKALGYNDFADFSRKYLDDMAADPVAKSTQGMLRELQNEIRNDRLALEEEKRQMREAQQRQQLQAETDRYKQNVAAKVAALSPALNRPDFVEEVVGVLQDFWDEQSQTTVSVEQAVGLLLDRERQRRAMFDPVFQPAAESTSGESSSAERSPSKGTPKIVTQNSRTDVSGKSAESDEFDEDQWLAEALAEHERLKRKRA